MAEITEVHVGQLHVVWGPLNKLLMCCKLNIILIISILIITGCNSQQKEIIHPVISNQPNNDSLNDLLSIHDSTEYRFYNKSIFKDYIYKFTIGGKLGESEISKYLFSVQPNSVKLDSKGNIYISRNDLNLISVYSPNGEYLYSFGGGGRGPGEFYKIIGFEFNDDKNKIYVLDLYEIEVFKFSNNKFKYEKSIPHGMIMVHDICFLDNSLFISGYKTIKNDNSDKPLTKYEILKNKVSSPISKLNLNDEQITTSFGYTYKSHYGYGLFDGTLSKMMLSCNSSTKTILGFQQDFSYMFGYDINGNEKWRANIVDYINAKHTEFRKNKELNPGIIQYSNSEIFNRKLPLPDTQLDHFNILQILNQTPQKYFADFDSSEIDNNIYTVLINSKNGKLYNVDFNENIGLVNDTAMILIKKNPVTFERKISLYEKK